MLFYSLQVDSLTPFLRELHFISLLPWSDNSVASSTSNKHKAFENDSEEWKWKGMLHRVPNDDMNWMYANIDADGIEYPLEMEQMSRSITRNS